MASRRVGVVATLALVTRQHQTAYRTAVFLGGGSRSESSNESGVATPGRHGRQSDEQAEGQNDGVTRLGSHTAHHFVPSAALHGKQSSATVDISLKLMFCFFNFWIICFCFWVFYYMLRCNLVLKKLGGMWCQGRGSTLINPAAASLVDGSTGPHLALNSHFWVRDLFPPTPW